MIDNRKALEMAGATIHQFQKFGSDLSGVYWARVEYEGRVGWVSGSYCNCEGCINVELTYGDDDLLAIGNSDLQHIYSQSEALVGAVDDWDPKSKEAQEFIRQYGGTASDR